MKSKPKKAQATDSQKAANGIRQRVYDSIAQASASEGIPVAVIRFAKKHGCPAFDHGRVNVFKFNEWYHARDGAGQNWDDKFKEFRAKREQQKFAREDGRTISTDDAESAGAIAIGTLNRVLRQSLCNDLPAATKGLDEVGIRSANEAALDRAFDDARKAFKEEIERSKNRDEDQSVAP